jgi:3-hydroxybutyryl-CoA dehydrogenase
MNPPHAMNLIEVIPGMHTNDTTFRLFWNLAEKLKKTLVKSQDSPGFILNRILIPMINFSNS